MGMRILILMVLLLALVGPAGVRILASLRDPVPSAVSSSEDPVPAPMETSLRSSQAAPQIVGESPAVAPALPLRLVGIFMSNEQRDSVAVLQDLESKEIFSHKVGDRLAYGASLIRIDVGEVILHSPAGGVYVLKLEQAASDPRKPITQLSPTERLVDVGVLRQQPVPLFLEFSQVKVAPRVEQGKVLGFGVRGAVPNGILNDLGVEEGDVVAAIDGQPLENYRRATELFGGLIQKDLSKVTLIKKDGKRMILTYHLVS